MSDCGLGSHERGALTKTGYFGFAPSISRIISRCIAPAYRWSSINGYVSPV
jgi:hypothetical protein